MSNPTPSSHTNNFDALRLFAALLVVFGHAFTLTGEAGPSFAGNGVATIGVKIFFVVSGYLVAASWARDPDFGRYMQRRLLRIMPAMIAVVLLTVFVLGPEMTNLSLAQYFSHPETLAYLGNLLFHYAFALPGVLAGNQPPVEVNGSLWSLPAEFSMYLLLPALVWFCAKAGGKQLFAAIALLFALTSPVLVRALPGIDDTLIYGTRAWAWMSVTPFFLLGACYALCGWQRFLDARIAALFLLALAASHAAPLIEEWLLLAALPYIVLAFGCASAKGLKGATRFGDLSYGIFLYAYPIQQVLVTAKLPGGAWLNFAMAAPIAAICAFASWHLVEKRALAFKPGTAIDTPMTVQPAE